MKREDENGCGVIYLVYEVIPDEDEKFIHEEKGAKVGNIKTYRRQVKDERFLCG